MTRIFFMGILLIFAVNGIICSAEHLTMFEIMEETRERLTNAINILVDGLPERKKLFASVINTKNSIINSAEVNYAQGYIDKYNEPAVLGLGNIEKQNRQINETLRELPMKVLETIYRDIIVNLPRQFEHDLHKYLKIHANVSI